MHAISSSLNAKDSPRTWMLLGDKTGDNEQLRTLGRSLGWPIEEKHLHYTRAFRLPNVLLGATRVSLAASSPSLSPPWPTIVLASGRRAVPVARWIRRRSLNRTRLVHLGRPRAPLRWFDVVIAPPHYGIPAAPNLLTVDLPLNALASERIDRDAAHWRSRVCAAAPPHLALVVGGATKSIAFDADAATRLGKTVSALARREGMSVLATTSRRTPLDAVEALARNLTVPHVLHRWEAAGTDNPYAAFLGLAERIVVTGDSASMIAEACRTGKPVTVVPPRQLDVAGWLERRVRGTVLATPLRRIGLCNGRPDMNMLIRRLADKGRVSVLGGADSAAASKPPRDELLAIADRVRSLVLRGSGSFMDTATAAR
ncbi:MAG: mitochondrial fission ELM1 family protein [Deltaproteobacteria bacterium]|nr:mitochondrial fission ELM1 family protein [Deltaproteobacteria bacterium]